MRCAYKYQKFYVAQYFLVYFKYLSIIKLQISFYPSLNNFGVLFISQLCAIKVHGELEKRSEFNKH